jgi:phage baseplate assembly protein W
MALDSFDRLYARDISFPMTFTEDCDLFIDENEQIINQALVLIVRTPKGTSVLFGDFGTDLMISLFDPNDDETQLLIDTSLRNSIELLEPRIFLDKDFVFDESTDGSKIIVLIPYKIIITGQSLVSRFIYRNLAEG